MREIVQAESIFSILENSNRFPKSFSEDYYTLIELGQNFYLIIYQFQGNRLMMFEINDFQLNHQDFFSLMEILSIRQGLVYEKAIDSLHEFILNNIDRNYFFDAH